MDEDRDEIRKLREEIERLKKEIERLKREGDFIGITGIMKTVNEAIERVVREIPLIIERELPKVYKRGIKGVGKRVIITPFKVDVKEEDKTSLKEDIEENVDEAISLIDSTSRGKGYRIDLDKMVRKIDAATVSDSIVVLANPDRIKILKMLYEGDRYFSELEEELGLGPSSLRHHLSKLMEGGLITQERMRGKYSITNRGIAALVLLAYLYERILGGE